MSLKELKIALANVNNTVVTESSVHMLRFASVIERCTRSLLCILHLEPTLYSFLYRSVNPDAYPSRKRSRSGRFWEVGSIVEPSFLDLGKNCSTLVVGIGDCSFSEFAGQYWLTTTFATVHERDAKILPV
jgi:hypothetical protein